jgi:hypothetical protein
MLLRLRSFVLCIVALFLLSSCMGDDSWCLTTDQNAYSGLDQIQSVTNTPASINGNGLDPNNPATLPGGWIYTGIPVQNGDTIQLSASGSILVAMPYGLQSATNGSSNDSYLYAAINNQSTSSYYENNGLGHQIVVFASSAAATTVNVPITNQPFNFVNGQNITVTTANCVTGDYKSNFPTKWTWSNWNTTAVQCSSRGTRNFTVNAPLCKAIKCCHGNTDTNVCYSTDEWQCQYVIVPSATSVVDVCASTTLNYNCGANASYKTPCYNTSGYNISGGWCGGSSGSYNITTSKDHPSFGADLSKYLTTPVLNTCGTTDSCWNTGGYRMYAFATGSTCPSGTGCVHLSQSSQINGGQSLQSQGGTLYLKIIDSNSSSSTSSTNVAALQTTVDTNNQTIAGLILTNNNLSDNLYMQKGVTTLSSGGIATSDGQLITINNFNGSNSSSYTSIASLQSSAITYSNGINDAANAMGNINTQLSNLIDSFGTFAGQLSPSDDLTIPWTILSTMAGQVSSLQASVNALSTSGTTATSVPSTTQVTTYKTNASSTLTALSNAIVTAQNTQNSINTNSTQINTLSAQNDTDNTQILNAQNAAPKQAVGGYTTYVRSDPVIAQDGVYLQAVVSMSDPYNDPLNWYQK